MLSTSRRRSPILGGKLSSAWQRSARSPRPRASACPLLLETLEERVLLSKGSGDAGVGPSAADLFAGDPSSLPKSQVVQIKISTLNAEGIPVPAQPSGVQDGQMSVLRFDNYLLIGGQFYQYASGQGYPLAPVAGPVLRGDVGVEHGPIPVLLPQQEPAFSAIPTPLESASPAPAIVSLPTEVPAPAAVALPENNSGEGLVAPVPSPAPASAAAANIASGTDAPAVMTVSPSLSAIPAAPADRSGDTFGAPAAISTPSSMMAGPLLAEVPAPAAVARPESNPGAGLVAPAAANIASGAISSPSVPAMPAVASAATGSHRDAHQAVQASMPILRSSVQALAGILGTVTATTDSAASMLVPTSASSGPVSPPLLKDVGSEPVLAPDVSGDRSLPRNGLPGEDLDTPSRPRTETARGSDSLPAGADTTSAMTGVTPPGPPANYLNALAAEVVDMLDLGLLERGGPSAEADSDSEGDTDSDPILVGVAIALSVGLAWGNFVFTARNADRHDDESGMSPD